LENVNAIVFVDLDVMMGQAQGENTLALSEVLLAAD
jgi:hypothetical protein